MAAIPFKLRLDSYGFEEPNVVDRRETRGGFSSFRLDATGQSLFVNASWFIPKDQLDDFWTFFDVTTLGGSAIFQADLIIDLPTLTTHNCQFVPDTQRIVPEGLDYVFRSRIEVLR